MSNPTTPRRMAEWSPVKLEMIADGRLFPSSAPLSGEIPLRVIPPTMVRVGPVDLFDPAVPDEMIDLAFAVMALTPQHTYKVSTAHPGRVLRWITEQWQPGVLEDLEGNKRPEPRGDTREDRVKSAAFTILRDCIFGDEDRFWTKGGHALSTVQPWPLRNVWIGVKITDQATADERLPILLDTPHDIALVYADISPRGPIDLRAIGHGDQRGLNALTGEFCYYHEETGDPTSEWGRSLHWVIVRGETGPDAKPHHPAWINRIRDDCVAAEIPFFFTGWGEWEPTLDAGDLAEYMATEAEDDHIRDMSKDTVILHPDGRIETPRPTREWWTLADEMLAPDPDKDPLDWGEGPIAMHRVGAVTAGRELDGTVWDQYPEVS